MTERYLDARLDRPQARRGGCTELPPTRRRPDG